MISNVRVRQLGLLVWKKKRIFQCLPSITVALSFFVRSVLIVCVHMFIFRAPFFLKDLSFETPHLRNNFKASDIFQSTALRLLISESRFNLPGGVWLRVNGPNMEWFSSWGTYMGMLFWLHCYHSQSCQILNRILLIQLIRAHEGTESRDMDL